MVTQTSLSAQQADLFFIGLPAYEALIKNYIYIWEFANGSSDTGPQ